MTRLNLAIYLLFFLSLIVGCGSNSEVEQTDIGMSVDLEVPQVFGIRFGSSADSILSNFEPPKDRAWKKTNYGMNEPSVKIWVESASALRKIEEFAKYDKSLDEVSYKVDSGRVNEIWLVLSPATSKESEVMNILSKELGIEGIKPDSVMSWGRDQKTVWISGIFNITRLLGADSSIDIYVSTM